MIWHIVFAACGAFLMAGVALGAYRPGGGFDAVPPDAALTVLGTDRFPVAGDGSSDDTAAIQSAIAAARGGVVIVPPGTYRLTDTLRLPKGVRLIGVGDRRPVLLVAPATPAFNGPARRPVVDFAPQEGRGGNDTFYSGIDHLDIEIRAGNPAASAIRFDAAQGSYISNAHLRLSEGNVGIERLGGEITHVRITGGDIAVQGGTVSWQTLILDCRFENQAVAALDVAYIGPTLVRTSIRDTPRGIVVQPGKGDWIYAEDCRFENVSNALIELDHRDDADPVVHLADCAFAGVPTVLRQRGGPTLPAPHAAFSADTVIAGLQVQIGQGAGDVERSRQPVIEGVRALASLPADTPSDIPPPPPVRQWKSAAEFGVAGDGKTDDTAALRRAVAEADILYLPPGTYLVRDTIELKPETRLIGLHPRSTLLRIDHQTPGFTDPANPRAVLQTPVAGANVVRGVGVDAGANPGAVALRWRSGPGSYLGDFWVSWSSNRAGAVAQSQYAALWIDGGGGVIKNFWTGHTNPPVGLLITDTDLPGRMYAASVEHKHGREVVLRNVSNWAFYALQTEHSQPDAAEEQTVPISIENGDNLLFANLYLYRTSGTRRPPRDGVSASGVQRLEIRNARNFSLSPHPARHTLELTDRGVAVEDRNLARIVVGEPFAAPPGHSAPAGR